MDEYDGTSVSCHAGSGVGWTEEAWTLMRHGFKLHEPPARPNGVYAYAVLDRAGAARDLGLRLGIEQKVTEATKRDCRDRPPHATA